MIKLIRKIQYNCWLMFGGKRTEDSFRFLSNRILENYKMINELRQENRELKSRVWALENHSLEESLDNISSQLDNVSSQFDKN